MESAFKIEEMTRKELEKENQSLRSKLKDKDAEILLIIQEASIVKPEYKNYNFASVYERLGKSAQGSKDMSNSMYSKNYENLLENYKESRANMYKGSNDGDNMYITIKS
jgi:hypothetical protein